MTLRLQLGTYHRLVSSSSHESCGHGTNSKPWATGTDAPNSRLAQKTTSTISMVFNLTRRDGHSALIPHATKPTAAHMPLSAVTVHMISSRPGSSSSSSTCASTSNSNYSYRAYGRRYSTIARASSESDREPGPTFPAGGEAAAPTLTLETYTAGLHLDQPAPLIDVLEEELLKARAIARLSACGAICIIQCISGSMPCQFAAGPAGPCARWL